LRNTLPKEAQNVGDTFIDTLINYTSLAPPALLAPEAAIAADTTTIALNNLGTAVKVARARPGLSSDIADGVTELFNAAPTAGELARINAALQQINHVQTVHETAKARPAAIIVP
jgi:hypothetical protein